MTRSLVLSLDALARNVDLPLDNLPGRSTDRVPLLDRVLEIEDVFDIIGEMLGKLLPLLHGEVGDLALELLGQGDGSAGDVVRLTERDLCVSRFSPVVLLLAGMSER